MQLENVHIERMNRINFRSCLNALARPGTEQRLIPLFQSPLLAAASCLLFPEVSSFFQCDEDFKLVQTLTGSPSAPVDEADYLFCDQADQKILVSMKIGHQQNPEDSATLFLSLQNGNTPRTEAVLTGPGINGSLEVTLPVDLNFLALLREINGNYPLGVDLFFMNEKGRLIGLPRTTIVEVQQ